MTEETTLLGTGADMKVVIRQDSLDDYVAVDCVGKIEYSDREKRQKR